MLHNMAGNDYRTGQAILHCVIPEELKTALTSKAKRHGVTLTAYVVDMIERDLDREQQPAPTPQPDPPLSGVKAVPDWDAILASGFAAKVGSVQEEEITVGAYDPLEEIA